MPLHDRVHHRALILHAVNLTVIVLLNQLPFATGQRRNLGQLRILQTHPVPLQRPLYRMIITQFQSQPPACFQFVLPVSGPPHYQTNPEPPQTRSLSYDYAPQQ